MGFCQVSTSSVISKHGSELRRQIDVLKRAKAKKNFKMKDATNAEQQAQNKTAARKQLANRIQIAFGMQELNLALALTRNRTVTTYGHSHYCKCHETLVDYEHIDNCNLIKPSKGLISDIIKVIENKKTI